MSLTEHIGSALEGEVLDPDLRHAVCGYVMRAANSRGMVAALCGAVVMLPLPRTSPRDKCPKCLPLAIQHAAGECDCFKLWGPNARLPR